MRRTRPTRQTPDAGPLLLTLDEASERSALSRRYLTRAVRDGRLRVARFGRAVRVDAVDLHAFVESAKGAK